MQVIEIDNLTVDYRTGFLRRRVHRALDSLSLEVSKGEVFGFLGPNGAGKTTTFRALLSLVRPVAGTARILGLPAGDPKMKAHIAYLAEHPCFYAHLTPAEFLVYCGRLCGMTRAGASSRAAVLIERFGLAGASGRLLRNFSKGMLQRVGLAQTLMHDPEILFLDEPMSGLDPLGRGDVRDLILTLRGEGRTIFFSSHILSDVEAMCDRVAIIDRGRLVEYGRLAEILASGGLEAMVAGIGEAVMIELRQEGFSIEATPSGACIRLPDDRRLGRLIGIVQGRGGRVISINPARQSLEDRFARSLKERAD